MLHPHPACLDDETLLAACRVTRGRASGPGGQHRNKVETAVTLLHEATGVTGWASERRSQAENQKVAMRRLRLNLAIEHRLTGEGIDKEATATTQSELWRSRLKPAQGGQRGASGASSGGRIVVATTHKDFPALLAEAMDVLAAHGYEPKPAATVLGCSASQLIKLLKQEPRAISVVNEKRKAMGSHVLK